MRLALFADIHANIEALDACLAHARSHGADSFAFLGDLVGYNADPGAVVDRIVALQEQEGAWVIKGNHDAAAAGDRSERMNEDATAAIDWTSSRLSPAQIEFLDRLPLVSGNEEICLVHATAAAPEKWGYVTDSLRAGASIEASARTYVFSGHVHDQVLYYMGADKRPRPFQPAPGISVPVGRHRRWLAIVGSTGQPRDGRTAACYAIFDTANKMLTFYRVAYDVASAARKVRQAGLPESFARRLETGL